MATDIARAADLIARARNETRRIRLPAQLRPRDTGEAYALQAAIGAALAHPATAPAWKVGAPDAHTEPNAAPIYEVLTSPAFVPAARMTMHAVEAEIAAVFGRALAPRCAPYDDTEVLDAISEVRVAIELCDSRLEDWESADDATRLGDHQLNFALVLGSRCERWRDLDLGTAAVLTRVDGEVLAKGAGCHAVGNPLKLLPWLANHARTRGGISAGTAVTTGAWLGLHRVAPGAVVRVEFAGLGGAEVTLTL